MARSYMGRNGGSNYGRSDRQSAWRSGSYSSRGQRGNSGGYSRGRGYRGNYRGNYQPLVTPNQYFQNQQNQNYYNENPNNQNSCNSNNSNFVNNRADQFLGNNNPAPSSNQEPARPHSDSISSAQSTSTSTAQNQINENDFGFPENFTPIYNWFKINNFVPGARVGTQFKFSFDSSEGPPESYIGNDVQDGSIRVPLDDKLFVIPTVEVEWGQLIPLLEKLDLTPNDLLVNGAGPGFMSGKGIVKTIKLRSIEHYCRMLHFGNYRISEHSAHRVIGDLAFMFCAWNYMGDNHWQLKLPDASLFTQKWYMAYQNFARGATISESDYVLKKLDELRIQHQNSFNHITGSSQIGTFPYNYRFRSDDLNTGLTFLTCRWRRSNAPFEPTETQNKFREKVLKDYPEQLIVTNRNMPLQLRIGQRVKGFLNGPRLPCLFNLDKFKFSKFDDETCLAQIRMTRKRVIDVYYSEYEQSSVMKEFSFEPKGDYPDRRAFETAMDAKYNKIQTVAGTFENRLTTLEQNCGKIDAKFVDDAINTKLKEVNDNITKLLDCNNDNRSLIFLQQQQSKLIDLKVNTLATMSANVNTTLFAENPKLIDMFQIAAPKNYTTIAETFDAEKLAFDTAFAAHKKGNYVAYETTSTLAARKPLPYIQSANNSGVVNDSFDKAFDVPKRIVSMDAFREIFASNLSDMDEVGIMKEKPTSQMLENPTIEQSEQARMNDLINDDIFEPTSLPDESFDNHQQCNDQLDNLPQLTVIDSNNHENSLHVNNVNKNSSAKPVNNVNNLNNVNNVNNSTNSQILNSKSTSNVESNNVSSNGKVSWPTSDIEYMYSLTYYKKENLLKSGIQHKQFKYFITVYYDLLLDILDDAMNIKSLPMFAKIDDELLSECLLLKNIIEKCAECIINKNFTGELTHTNNFGHKIGKLKSPPITAKLYVILQSVTQHLNITLPNMYDIGLFKSSLEDLHKRIKDGGIISNIGQKSLSSYMVKSNNQSKENSKSHNSRRSGTMSQPSTSHASRRSLNKYKLIEKSRSDSLVVNDHEFLGVENDIFDELEIENNTNYTEQQILSQTRNNNSFFSYAVSQDTSQFFFPNDLDKPIISPKKMKHYVDSKTLFNDGSNPDANGINLNLLQEHNAPQATKWISSFTANNAINKRKFKLYKSKDNPIEIISINLNDPSKQINNILAQFSEVDIICIQELNINEEHLKNKLCFPSHFTAYTSESFSIHDQYKVFAAILVRNNLNYKVTVKYCKGPFVSIYVKIPLSNKELFCLNVTTFYRCHLNSVKTRAMKIFTNNQFNRFDKNHFDKLSKILINVPSILTGDINLEAFKNRTFDNINIKRHFCDAFNFMSSLITQPTFYRGDSKSEIDVFLINKLEKDYLTFSQNSGPLLAKNDGHDLCHLYIHKDKLMENNEFTIHKPEVPSIQELLITGKKLLIDNSHALHAAIKDTNKLLEQLKNEECLKPKITPLSELLQKLVEDYLKQLCHIKL